MKKSVFLLSVACMALMMLPSAFADLYWESEVIALTMEPKINKTYQTDYAVRIESGNDITIANYKAGVILSLDMANKTYTEMKFDEIFEGESEENKAMAEQMANMLEQMMKSMTVERTKETKKINGYNCTKCNVTMMGMASEYWVTSEIKEFSRLTKAAKKYADIFKKNQKLASIFSQSEMFEKLGGFPMMTSTAFGGMKSTSEVKEIVVKELKTSLFEPPAGYAKVKAH